MKRSGSIALLLLVFAFVSVSCDETAEVTTSGSLGTQHDNINIETIDVEETARMAALKKAKERASDVHKKMMENRVIQHKESNRYIHAVEKVEVVGAAVHSETTEEEVEVKMRASEVVSEAEVVGAAVHSETTEEEVEVKMRASEVISEAEEKEEEGGISCGDNQNTSSSPPVEPFVTVEGLEGRGTHTRLHETKCLNFNEDVNQTFLTFSQETAPSSNNALLTHVASLVNEHLEGVLNVDISLRGNPKNTKVGKFMITAVINRIVQLENGRQESVEECLEIPYEITDIDECSLPPSHPMSHSCHPSTQCVNVVGSYECSCKRGSWGVKGSGSPYPQKGVVLRLLAYLGLIQGGGEKSRGSCGGKANTSECCFSAHYHDDLWISEKNCKSDFRCTSNSCLGEKCPSRSSCVPGAGYSDFHCVCKPGYKVSAVHVIVICC